MSYILHLGHQPTDISGIAGLISTTAGGFDPNLDINAIRFAALRPFQLPFAIEHPAPIGDLWLGFRYVPPNGDAQTIGEATANFLEFYDALNNRIAQIRPMTTTSRYHAFAHGDTSVQGNSSYAASNGQPQWVDVRVAVGVTITIDLYVDGVLHSTASAANTQAKGKPVRVVFANSNIHGGFISRVWSYAHIAILDGVSTIGRRFVRRTPGTLGAFAQMSGSLDALKDDDISTRVSSNVVGQRLSFSLAGPTGPAAVSAIAGVHIKQIAQAGTEGPTAASSFLRIAGVNHDAAPSYVPALMPKALYSTWATNPTDGSPWTSATLPAEIGIMSA